MKKKDLYFLVVLLVVGVMLFGVGFAKDNAPPFPPIVKELLAEAKKSIRSIDMKTLNAVLQNKEDVTIIDVRLPKDYEEGHVPGAINIPRGLLEFMIWKKVVGYPQKQETTKKIYLYCGNGNRSALGTKSLQDLGFTNAIWVDMKIAEWTKAGYPIEK